MPTVNPLRWLWNELFGPVDDGPPAPDELVTVGTANGLGLAGLWQSTLEGQGIHCVVKTLGLPSMYGMATCYVQVQYKDLKRAQELLGLDTNAAPHA
jgi:hypothetical protein